MSEEDERMVLWVLNKILDRHGYQWGFARKLVIRGTMASLRELLKAFEEK